MIKILHFTPVRKPADILAFHLQSLADLKITNFEICFSFYDDNTDLNSCKLLKNFTKTNSNSFIFDPLELTNFINNSNERWEKQNYDRVTQIKNHVIKYFVESNFDFLFLTDADLVLHPQTVVQLLSNQKSFCAEIFWTKFAQSSTYLPNCWNGSHTVEDLLCFRNKGIYKVGYTGACTLLDKNILQSGVSFAKISNVPYLGEDKHFCIRATVHNFDIFIDTNYPAFHIYDKSLINHAHNFISTGYDNNYLKEWLNDDWIHKFKKQSKPKFGFVRKLIKRIKRIL